MTTSTTARPVGAHRAVVQPGRIRTTIIAALRWLGF